MQIHLFISEHAQAGDRLKVTLKSFMQSCPVIQYQNLEAVGRVIPTDYNGMAVAVIMVSDKEELALLADRKNIWAWFKTILILPDDEPETISLGHSFNPRFMTYMDSDFSDVEAILEKMLTNKNNE